MNPFSLTFLSSGLYFSTLMLISPIYIVFLVSVASLIIRFIVKSLPAFSDCIFCYCLLILIIVISLLNDSYLNISVNFILSLIFFIATRLSINNISEENIFKTIYVISFIYAVLFAIEAFIRFYYPVLFNPISGVVYSEVPGLWIYAYKLNSIMFADSNFTAICILSFSSLLYYLFLIGRKEFSILLVIYFILILLTFSRASVLAFFTIFFASHLLKSKNKIFTSIFAIFLFSVVGYFLILNTLSSEVDGSTSIKLIMLFNFFNIYPTLDWLSIVFGIGFGNAIDLLGYGTHIYLLTILLEGGLVMLFFQILFWIFLYRRAPGIAIILIPFFVTSLSFASHANTVFYSCLAIAYHIERSSKFKDYKIAVT